MFERRLESPSAPSDGDLLLGVYARDVSSLELLYDRHSALVYALALRILRRPEEAEEIVQDVFWQLWKGRVRYEPERGRFGGWLFSITRSRCVDKLRGRRRHANTEELPDDSPARGANPEAAAFASERACRVTEALLALPAAQKQAIELCFYEGLSHTEVADRLGEPLGTVKSRIKMGMAKLKLSLKTYGSAG